MHESKSKSQRSSHAGSERAASFARVVSRDAEGIFVRWEGSPLGEVLMAKRALSCLVDPEVGDRVLLGGTSQDLWVLAVLSRTSSSASRLVVDGDLQLRVGGTLDVAAADGVTVVTPAETSLLTGTLRAHALDARVVLEKLSFVGTLLRAEVAKIGLLASTVDSVVERVVQRVKRSYRTVEESDHVRAERIEYTAKKTMSLRGEHTLVTAKELVKADAAQIHLG